MNHFIKNWSIGVSNNCGCSRTQVDLEVQLRLHIRLLFQLVLSICGCMIFFENGWKCATAIIRDLYNMDIYGTIYRANIAVGMKMVGCNTEVVGKGRVRRVVSARSMFRLGRCIFLVYSFGSPFGTCNWRRHSTEYTLHSHIRPANHS